MNNEYILITGASSGIGLELAKKYAKQGEKLILVARRKDILEGFKEVYPDTVIFDYDLSNVDNAKALYQSTKEMNLEVKFLINNAGFGEFGEFIETDMEKEINMINLNITTLMVLTKLYLKDMVEKNKGRILNVASIASYVPGPRMSVYYATKAFVKSFAEAVRYEVRKTDVEISILCPGPTETGFIKSSNLDDVKLFGKNALYTAEGVADYTIKHIDKGIIIPGFLNRLGVFLSKIIPNFILLFLINIIQSRKED